MPKNSPRVSSSSFFLRAVTILSAFQKVATANQINNNLPEPIKHNPFALKQTNNPLFRNDEHADLNKHFEIENVQNDDLVTPPVTPTRLPTAIPTRLPTFNPTITPSNPPTRIPSLSPTTAPTFIPTLIPTITPTASPTRQPTGQPSSQPTVQPSIQPSSQPSAQPSRQPTKQPSGQPTSKPSSQPSGQPSSNPSNKPSSQPTSRPSKTPSSKPTSQPTKQPTSTPSQKPSAQPTSNPSTKPTSQPSSRPSSKPFSKPTSYPSGQPSKQPSTQPTSTPSAQPSKQPSKQPSSKPSGQPSTQPTSTPSAQPSKQPSSNPTSRPSRKPSSKPTSQPSKQPTSKPSVKPTVIPSAQPFSWPTAQPTSTPSGQPSKQPTSQPSSNPSSQPSSQPSLNPSAQPSSTPSISPSSIPSISPSGQPSLQPTSFPSARPTSFPSGTSTSYPTSIPSLNPSGQPSSTPSSYPTAIPSRIPSSFPSSQPSSQPTSWPSSQPSLQPSTQPSASPSVEPSSFPTVFPTAFPSSIPSNFPSGFPSSQPSGQPSKKPSSKPSNQPSSIPSAQPSSEPTLKPSSIPSGLPSSKPSSTPTSQPSRFPSVIPSSKPSTQPSSKPTSQPSYSSSSQPTNQPTSQPTSAPSSKSSSSPTSSPTAQPSLNPSISPSTRPTSAPTFSPSQKPISIPSAQPSRSPISEPSLSPSVIPSSKPSNNPSNQPTSLPSSKPSSQPSRFPSSLPSSQPTLQPFGSPTYKPNSLPSAQPSVNPSAQPSSQPSLSPTSESSSNPTSSPISEPSSYPTNFPTGVPTLNPSSIPSKTPSVIPSSLPSSNPNSSPTNNPSLFPSLVPSSLPSFQPTGQPSSQPSTTPSQKPSLRGASDSANENQTEFGAIAGAIVGGAALIGAATYLARKQNKITPLDEINSALKKITLFDEDNEVLLEFDDEDSFSSYAKYLNFLPLVLHRVSEKSPANFDWAKRIIEEASMNRANFDLIIRKNQNNQNKLRKILEQSQLSDFEIDKIFDTISANADPEIRDNFFKKYFGKAPLVKKRGIDFEIDPSGNLEIFENFEKFDKTKHQFDQNFEKIIQSDGARAGDFRSFVKIDHDILVFDRIEIKNYYSLSRINDNLLRKVEPTSFEPLCIIDNKNRLLQFKTRPQLQNYLRNLDHFNAIIDKLNSSNLNEVAVSLETLKEQLEEAAAKNYRSIEEKSAALAGFEVGIKIAQIRDQISEEIDQKQIDKIEQFLRSWFSIERFDGDDLKAPKIGNLYESYSINHNGNIVLYDDLVEFNPNLHRLEDNLNSVTYISGAKKDQKALSFIQRDQVSGEQKTYVFEAKELSQNYAYLQSGKNGVNLTFAKESQPIYVIDQNNILLEFESEKAFAIYSRHLNFFEDEIINRILLSSDSQGLVDQLRKIKYELENRLQTEINKEEISKKLTSILDQSRIDQLIDLFESIQLSHQDSNASSRYFQKYCTAKAPKIRHENEEYKIDSEGNLVIFSDIEKFNENQHFVGKNGHFVDINDSNRRFNSSAEIIDSDGVRSLFVFNKSVAKEGFYKVSEDQNGFCSIQHFQFSHPKKHYVFDRSGALLCFDGLEQLDSYNAFQNYHLNLEKQIRDSGSINSEELIRSLKTLSYGDEVDSLSSLELTNQVAELLNFNEAQKTEINDYFKYLLASTGSDNFYEKYYGEKPQILKTEDYEIRDGNLILFENRMALDNSAVEKFENVIFDGYQQYREKINLDGTQEIVLDQFPYVEPREIYFLHDSQLLVFKGDYQFQKYSDHINYIEDLKQSLRSIGLENESENEGEISSPSIQNQLRIFETLLNDISIAVATGNSEKILEKSEEIKRSQDIKELFSFRGLNQSDYQKFVDFIEQLEDPRNVKSFFEKYYTIAPKVENYRKENDRIFIRDENFSEREIEVFHQYNAEENSIETQSNKSPKPVYFYDQESVYRFDDHTKLSNFLENRSSDRKSQEDLEANKESLAVESFETEGENFSFDRNGNLIIFENFRTLKAGSFVIESEAEKTLRLTDADDENLYHFFYNDDDELVIYDEKIIKDGYIVGDSTENFEFREYSDEATYIFDLEGNLYEFSDKTEYENFASFNNYFENFCDDIENRIGGELGREARLWLARSRYEIQKDLKTEEESKKLFSEENSKKTYFEYFYETIFGQRSYIKNSSVSPEELIKEDLDIEQGSKVAPISVEDFEWMTSKKKIEFIFSMAELSEEEKDKFSSYLITQETKPNLENNDFYQKYFGSFPKVFRSNQYSFNRSGDVVIAENDSRKTIKNFHFITPFGQIEARQKNSENSFFFVCEEGVISFESLESYNLYAEYKNYPNSLIKEIKDKEFASGTKLHNILTEIANKIEAAESNVDSKKSSIEEGLKEIEKILESSGKNPTEIDKLRDYFLASAGIEDANLYFAKHYGRPPQNVSKEYLVDDLQNLIFLGNHQKISEEELANYEIIGHGIDLVNENPNQSSKVFVVKTGEEKAKYLVSKDGEKYLCDGFAPDSYFRISKFGKIEKTNFSSTEPVYQIQQDDSTLKFENPRHFEQYQKFLNYSTELHQEILARLPKELAYEDKTLLDETIELIVNEDSSLLEESRLEEALGLISKYFSKAEFEIISDYIRALNSDSEENEIENFFKKNFYPNLPIALNIYKIIDGNIVFDEIGETVEDNDLAEKLREIIERRYNVRDALDEIIIEIESENLAEETTKNIEEIIQNELLEKSLEEEVSELLSDVTIDILILEALSDEINRLISQQILDEQISKIEIEDAIYEVSEEFLKNLVEASLIGLSSELIDQAQKESEQKNRDDMASEDKLALFISKSVIESIIDQVEIKQVIEQQTNLVLRNVSDGISEIRKCADSIFQDLATTIPVIRKVASELIFETCREIGSNRELQRRLEVFAGASDLSSEENFGEFSLGDDSSVVVNPNQKLPKNHGHDAGKLNPTAEGEIREREEAKLQEPYRENKKYSAYRNKFLLTHVLNERPHSQNKNNLKKNQQPTHAEIIDFSTHHNQEMLRMARLERFGLGTETDKLLSSSIIEKSPNPFEETGPVINEHDLKQSTLKRFSETLPRPRTTSPRVKNSEVKADILQSQTEARAPNIQRPGTGILRPSKVAKKLFESPNKDKTNEK